MRTCRNSPFFWMVKISCPRKNPFLCKGWFSLYHGFVEKFLLSHDCLRNSNILNATQKPWWNCWFSPVGINFHRLDMSNWWPSGVDLPWISFDSFHCVIWAALMYSRHLCRTSGEAFFFSEITRYLWWLCSTKFLQGICTFVHWFQGWIVFSIKNWRSKSLALCIN